MTAILLGAMLIIYIVYKAYIFIMQKRIDRSWDKFCDKLDKDSDFQKKFCDFVCDYAKEESDRLSKVIKKKLTLGELDKGAQRTPNQNEDIHEYQFPSNTEETSMTTDEFIKAFVQFIAKMITEEVETNFQRMLKYVPDRKERLRRELFYYLYFTIDYILHSLLSTAKQDNNQDADSIFEKVREDLTKVLMNTLSVQYWEAGMIDESLMAYREVLARGKDRGDKIMNIGLEFARRSANEDIYIASVASTIFKTTWEHLRQTMWETVIGYLQKQ